MAADVEGVQRLLEELHRHSRENFPDSEINDPAALVEQLSIAVLALDPRSPGQEADVALFASFVFESQAPRDLLSFVTDTINSSAKVTKKSRMAALKVVGNFSKRLKGTPVIDRYAQRIKDDTWAVFSKERESQEVRAHALRPLRALLKLRSPNLAAEKWNVAGMWATIREQYSLGTSKISQSCKGELLKLAGSLVLVYGRDVPELAEGVKIMLGWCDAALNDNAKSQKLGKALQPQIVAGALACIDLLCSAGFEERYTYKAGESASKPNTKLYMHLLRAVQEGSAQDLSRFEVPAKALRFFRRHARLFSDNIGPLSRARQLYDLMEQCATAGGRSSRLKLKKHALPAIEATLREVARYTASRPANKDTLDKLEGTFLKLLEGAKPSAEEVTVALAGLAALSPAATALSSYQDAADVADRLLVCLDAARGQLDEVGFAGEDSDEEDGGNGSPGARGTDSYGKDKSLKLEAQFLRTLACRAGVLGGVFARERQQGDASPGLTGGGDGVVGMDVDEEGGPVAGKGKGGGVRGGVPGGMGGAVPGHLMRRLQSLSLRLVENYALLSSKDRGLACQGLCQLWLALSGPGQGDNLSRMLGVVVQKGVSLAGTMENPGGGIDEAGEPSDAPVKWVAPVDPVTGAVDARLCFLYADLWRRVVNPGSAELEPLQAWEALPGSGAAAAAAAAAAAVSGVSGVLYRDAIAPEVYDAVLGAVLTAVKRLDLRYTYGTPEEGGRPIPLHATDQNMFLNLVSFCQDLLPTCRPDLLLEWVPILCPELVKRSLERPLVSGFYRLVTLVFRETARSGYFDDHTVSPETPCDQAVLCPPSPGSVVTAIGLDVGGSLGEGASSSSSRSSSSSGGGGGGRGDQVSTTGGGGGGQAAAEERVGDGGERINCRRILCRYLEWMTVRLGGFRDELLAACTETLLSAPVGLLGGDLSPLVPALRAALTSGTSHLPTAVVAVEALERWREETPNLLWAHLGEILPHLDKHLSAGPGGDGGSAEKVRRSKGGKAAGSSASAGGSGDTAGEESRRKDLRRRIVRFLGRLGGRNHLVATDASKALSDSLAWDTTPRILLNVPFKDRQNPLTICLDGVLQRLVELALHEGARQTKTLAAECLHALVVYMVGCTATDPSSGQQGRPGDFSKLFRRVFPAVLRLAVDLDETTRTLFSKLSMQLVRWFSQAQTENDDTLALLDCLGEGAAAEEGGPLREVCAKGVVEFLRYAIKQSTKRQQAEGPVAVDALLTRVFSLATHPDKNRRLGGLMAFNQLCRPLREETALLNRYALRLLHVALISLRRAHHDHSALGVADAASSAVDRALRVVHESITEKGDRGDLLRKRDERGELRSVEEMAGWAWDRVGAVETRFRRKCMTVLLALCPLVVETFDGLDETPSENDGARTWVWRRLEESGRAGITEAVRVFESSASQSQAFSSAAVGGGGFKAIGGEQGAELRENETMEWDRIATAADCYNFARDTGIITAAELFLGAPKRGGGGDGGVGGTSQKKSQSSGKKRKASSAREDAAADGSGGGDSSSYGSEAAEPLVVRSLAGVVERFGKFLEDFPFQSLAGEEERDGDAGVVQGDGLRHPTVANVSGTVAARLAAEASRPLVVDDPGLLPTERAAAQLSRAVLLRRGFTLLAGCLSDDGARRDEMAAFLVKEGLWSRRAHLVVIYCLVWPWAGEFLPRASDGDEVEQFLPAAVERLLKHWKTLDNAAGPGNGLSETLQSLLRVRVSKEDSARLSAASPSSGEDDAVDLCQWILAQSLSSQQALSRPFVSGRAGRKPSTARSNARRSPTPPDDELTGRVIRAYRSFANSGLFGSVGGGGGEAFRLASGLWSTVVRLPEGLRPASEHRAKTVLRLSMDLGLPTTTGATIGAASILAGLLDLHPAKRAAAASAVGVGGATRGSLFYRRFSEPIHDALLRRGAGCPWSSVCKALVDACLSTTAGETRGHHPLLAAQAFSVLEGVLILQSERATGATTLTSRATMDPSETLSVILPEFRRLVEDPDWGPPPTAVRGKTGGSAAVGVHGTGKMLRESLRLCHRLLRLAAAVKSGSPIATSASGSSGSSTTSPPYFERLLEMSALLVARTLGSSSSVVDASTKADALTLVPFLRPCITRKARNYGHAVPHAGRQGEGGAGGAGASAGGKGKSDGLVMPAMEEMMSMHFPIDNSREPAEGSEQATAFALLLRGLLGAFVRCGDLGLLELLFGTLAEGRKHRHYRWVDKALDAFVSGLDMEASGVAEAVLGFCLDKLTAGRVGASVRTILFDKVCLPMLRHCPAEIVKSLYLSATAGSGFRPVSKGKAVEGALLRRLFAVIGKRSKAGAFLDGPLVASCCFSLLEVLYDAFDLEPLQALADSAFRKKKTSEDGPAKERQEGDEEKALTLKDVTLGVCNAWKAVVASEEKFSQNWLELRCRRAVFSCVCTAVRATQDKEKFFDKLVWSDALYAKSSGPGGGKTSVLALVLNMETEHTFEVSPKVFQSSRLLPARPPPLGRGRSAATTGRSRGGMTASSMLSQSSLGFGGDSLAVVAGGDGGAADPAAEDERETYSSQAALTEPAGVPEGDGEPGTDSQHPRSQSQSQGDMAPVFGRGAVESAGGGTRGGGNAEEDAVFLEMSHVNKEPCMRSLLQVMVAQQRLFGDSWNEQVDQSNGMFEPAWSVKMRAKLEDIDLPRNVRILAFQFALNAPVSTALLPWAVPWIKALSDFALAPLPEGLRTDGEDGLHYLLRDFTLLLLDESGASGWGRAVREARAEERRRAAEAGGDPGDVSRQPLLDVGNRLVSHLMSVASCPDGKTPMLRANVLLVAGLVGLFGDEVVEQTDHNGDVIRMEGHRTGRTNDLRLNLQFVVDMLKEREGHTGGAHASTQSKGVQAKHTILTGLNLLGVLLGMKVPVLTSSVPAADQLARTLPDVCLSYTQKNTFETGTELLAMALAHVSWLEEDGGLPLGDSLCPVLRQAEGSEWLARRVTDRLMRMGRDGKLRSRFVHAVAAISGVYPAVMTRQLLLSSLGAMQFADASCRGRLLETLADNFPRGQVPTLEVQDLFTRLQPYLPSLLLEPEVEFVRGSKEAGTPSEWVPRAQLSALRLLRELTKTMTSKQLGAVLGEDDAHSLVGLATPSTYRGCREVAYATLLDLHVAAREQGGLANSGSGSGVGAKGEGARGGAALTHAQRETVRCALLRGLSDPDDDGMTFDDKAPAEAGAEGGRDTNTPSQPRRHGIRRSLLEVFDAPPSAGNGGGGLEEDPGLRLLSLMRDMFDSRTARAWLRFAPYLLLRPAEEASGYNDVLFKKSLLSCEFVNMSVAGGAGGGVDARPMEPAFSYASLSSQQLSQDNASIASYNNGGGGGGGGSYGTISTDVEVREAGYLRATQDYLWSQTQGAGGGGRAAGRRGGGGAAAAAGARVKYVAFPSQTQSKMLGGPSAYAGSQAAMPPPAPRAPGTRGSGPRGGGGGVSSQAGGVGRRFWRTSGGSVSSIAKGETYAMQKRMAAKRARDKTTRAKRAVIYRKYRDGELPDIMIKLGDVLRPLQHLSMLDGGIAREVFVQIFKEVYAGFGGSARNPSASQPADKARTQPELDDEIQREASVGEGRRAVSVLLQRMLSAARHDTDVVACLHAACRATATAVVNPPYTDSGDGGDGGGGGGSGRSSSSSLQQREQRGQHHKGRIIPSSSSSSSTAATGRRARIATAEEPIEEVTVEGGDAISLSPDLVANTALSSLNVHSGILLLEESIMRIGKERAAVAAATDAVATTSGGATASGGGGGGGGGGRRRRRGSGGGDEKNVHVVDVEKGQQDAWLQLSKLYASLGERDALVGVAARASKSEGTRQALEAELSGEYDVALRMYKKLLDRYDTRFEKETDTQDSSAARGMDEEGVEGASEAELRAWDMHQLECMRQLGQWKTLRGEVVAMVSEGVEGEDEIGGEEYGDDARGSAECQRRLWGADPSQRDDVLPFFVWSIVHDHRRSEIALNAFLDAIVDPEAPSLRLTDSSWGGGEGGTAGESSSLALRSGAEGGGGGSTSSGSSSSSSPSASTCTRMAWLETNMPAELAKAFLLGNQLGRAHQCVARCYDRFHEKWAGLHPCADSARRDQLRGLQLVVEVEDFLSFYDKKGTTTSTSTSSLASSSKGAVAVGLGGRLNRLLDKWSRQTPSQALDPVTSWTAMLAHRQDCFKAIEIDLEEAELPEKQRVALRRDMLKHTGDLSIVAAGAATAQGVHSVAGKLIKSYADIKDSAGRLGTASDKQGQAPPTRGTDGDDNWDLQLTLTAVELNRVRLERLRLAGNRTGADLARKQADYVARTLKVLGGCISQQQQAIGKRASGGSRGWGEGEGWETQGAEAHETRLRLLTLQGQWLETKGLLLAENNSSGGGQEEEAAESFCASLASLEKATELGDGLTVRPTGSKQSPTPGSSTGNASGTTPTPGAVEATGEAMLRLAKLCDAMSAGDSTMSGVGGRGREDLAALAVKEYLRAMAVGSAGARHSFPRVLYLAGKFSKARAAFADGASAVPEWAFLRWISQMLGVTGREEGPVVIQVLERVALAYPRALFYPLLMTKASAAARNGEGGAGADDDGRRLSRLTALTADPSAEAFAEALRGLHHPEMRFSDGMKRVCGLLNKSQKDLARVAYRKLRNDCLVTTGRKTGDDKVGSYNREFAKKHIRELDKAMGKDGELLNEREARRFLFQGRKWQLEVKKSSRLKLSGFSTWMSDFDSNRHKLEVPGQYGGMSAAPPRVSLHSRIVSFDSELLLMNSLRLPKRLTMHGDDEKDHMFLVKGGEDLRVDQRVEQLFEVMNAVMATSAGCRRARLSNTTYKVVPVTPEIGLIEWVQNTRPLKSVIEQGLGTKLGSLSALDTFGKFLKAKPKQFPAPNFHEMFKTEGRPKVEEMFATCCATVPTDALRKHLLAMAPSPEAFLTCRGGFARSLATLNACSYVLGIGDRHLDNFLLDTMTGTVVGIDFGAAFGIAHTELGVPELIPFRLTNQFQNLLQPLDSVGLLKGHMVSTLQALRAGREVLLATMDVFLNEPVMDWISEGVERRQAKTKRGGGGGSGEDAADEGLTGQPRPPFEARRKIKNAKRKLLGENPAAVLIDDLGQNLSVKQLGSLAKLEAISWGSSGDRVRSKPEHREGWLSVEDQVDCLIDLATDPDVLGRQWVGLATWV